MSDYRLVTIGRETRSGVAQALMDALSEHAADGFELHTVFPYDDRIFVITVRPDDGTAPQIRSQRT